MSDPEGGRRRMEEMSMVARQEGHWLEGLGEMGVPQVQQGIWTVVRLGVVGMEDDLMVFCFLFVSIIPG